MPEDKEEYEQLLEGVAGKRLGDGRWNPALALALVHNGVVEVVQADELLGRYGQGSFAPDEVVEGRVQTTGLGRPLAMVRVAPSGSNLSVVPSPKGGGGAGDDSVEFFTYNVQVTHNFFSLDWLTRLSVRKVL